MVSEYDDEPAEGFGTSLNSAILKPYRHILVPPSPARNEPEYDDLDDDFKSVAPNGKRELAEEDYRDVQARYARSVLERGGNDLTEEERLTAEWGLKQHFSQLGSGSDLGDYAIADSPEYDTRSLPDLLDRRTSTFSTASTSALETAASLAPSTSQLRIAEYAQGARPRSRSLGHDLAIPHFDPLPSLVIPDDDLLTARPRPRRSSTLDDGFAHPRPRSRAMSGTSKRLSIASIATMLSRQELDNHHEPGDRRQSFHDRRLAFLSGGGADTTSALLDDEPLAESVSAVEWTSRFDPQMLVLARQADKERAVFVNKDAGATPKSLLMPTPLAGQARAPFKRTRTEGPETIIPQTQEEADEMAALEKERNTRPAGALFGRSLMDVMAEKQAALKAKQRHYVPGNDGRRSMMDPDWGKPKPLDIADDLFLSDAASEKGLAPPRLPRGKSTLSIFGPDLFYARDLERLREMERVEAEEDELEALKEADMWEKERLKAEKKQTSKMRKAAERKLEGLDVKGSSRFYARWTAADSCACRCLRISRIGTTCASSNSQYRSFPRSPDRSHRARSRHDQLVLTAVSHFLDLLPPTSTRRFPPTNFRRPLSDRRRNSTRTAARHAVAEATRGGTASGGDGWIAQRIRSGRTDGKL